jgi:hypothetical protein
MPTLGVRRRQAKQAAAKQRLFEQSGGTAPVWQKGIAKPLMPQPTKPAVPPTVGGNFYGNGNSWKNKF